MQQKLIHRETIDDTGKTRAQTIRKNIVTEHKARSPEENDLDYH